MCCVDVRDIIQYIYIYTSSYIYIHIRIYGITRNLCDAHPITFRHITHFFESFEPISRMQPGRLLKYGCRNAVAQSMRFFGS